MNISEYYLETIGFDLAAQPGFYLLLKQIKNFRYMSHTLVDFLVLNQLIKPADEYTIERTQQLKANGFRFIGFGNANNSPEWAVIMESVFRKGIINEEELTDFEMNTLIVQNAIDGI